MFKFYLFFCKADTLYRIEFVFFFFDIIFVCLRTTQNTMLNALKPKPLSSTLSLWLRWKNNVQRTVEHKPSHMSLTSYHFNTFELTFKFLLAMSTATDLTVFVCFFFIFYCSTNVPSTSFPLITIYSTTVSSVAFPLPCQLLIQYLMNNIIITKI